MLHRSLQLPVVAAGRPGFVWRFHRLENSKVRGRDLVTGLETSLQKLMHSDKIDISFWSHQPATDLKKVSLDCFFFHISCARVFNKLLCLFVLCYQYQRIMFDV